MRCESPKRTAVASADASSRSMTTTCGDAFSLGNCGMLVPRVRSTCVPRGSNTALSTASVSEVPSITKTCGADFTPPSFRGWHISRFIPNIAGETIHGSSATGAVCSEKRKSCQNQIGTICRSLSAVSLCVEVPTGSHADSRCPQKVFRDVRGCGKPANPKCQTASSGVDSAGGCFM